MVTITLPRKAGTALGFTGWVLGPPGWHRFPLRCHNPVPLDKPPRGWGKLRKKPRAFTVLNKLTRIWRKQLGKLRMPTRGERV